MVHQGRYRELKICLQGCAWRASRADRPGSRAASGWPAAERWPRAVRSWWRPTRRPRAACWAARWRHRPPRPSPAWAPATFTSGASRCLLNSLELPCKLRTNVSSGSVQDVCSTVTCKSSAALYRQWNNVGQCALPVLGRSGPLHPEPRCFKRQENLGAAEIYDALQGAASSTGREHPVFGWRGQQPREQCLLSIHCRTFLRPPWRGKILSVAGFIVMLLRSLIFAASMLLILPRESPSWWEL